jgi:hypothetical protein
MVKLTYNTEKAPPISWQTMKVIATQYPSSILGGYQFVYKRLLSLQILHIFQMTSPAK